MFFFCLKHCWQYQGAKEQKRAIFASLKWGEWWFRFLIYFVQDCRPFRAHKFLGGLYINLSREATLCQNILSVLRIFVRISKFRFFHETKETQNVVGRFFYNLAEFVFEYFCDGRRIVTTFAKFCLNSLFAA